MKTGVFPFVAAALLASTGVEAFWRL